MDINMCWKGLLISGIATGISETLGLELTVKVFCLSTVAFVVLTFFSIMVPKK